MRLEIRPPLVLVHDDSPGRHGTLFSIEGQQFVYREDTSSFAYGKYIWAFEAQVKWCDRLVFATHDREMIVAVGIDGAEPCAVGVLVERGADQKPMGLINRKKPRPPAQLLPVLNAPICRDFDGPARVFPKHDDLPSVLARDF